MMRAQERVRLSKFLSFVLRHRPQEIGLTLDPAGWADVDALIDAAREHGVSLDRDRLVEVVEKSPKKRFDFGPDGSSIRATYGHSIAVDVRLEPRRPPRYLFHGTARGNLDSIRTHGLRSQNRQFVHLSRGREEARRVGRRHGKPVILEVRARALADEGHRFFSPNEQIWLTEKVPPWHIEVEE